MLHGEALGLLVGAVALGAVHGVEPGHGWPVAASYALDQTNKWAYGFAASLILGVGHLLSSIAMVGVFFYAKSYFDLAAVNEPVTLVEGVRIGGPVSIAAGVVLVALGVREYRHGHDHGQNDGHGHHRGQDHDHDHDHGHHRAQDHGSDHDHDHGHHRAQDRGGERDSDHDHGHTHDPEAEEGGLLARLTGLLPYGGGHSHDHGDLDEAADRGLLGIAWFAFLLGFAHEEEFEIIALCVGSEYCLELMGAYAVTVVFGIVALTMLLIAGYHHFEETVEQYTPYLPAFSAAVLVVMGTGFVVGVF